MANERAKGLSYERDVAEMLRQFGFPNAKRHLEFQKDEAKGIDLDNTWPLGVQCKAWKSAPPITVIDEIVDGRFPIRTAILKRKAQKGKHKIEVAVVDVEAFYAMIKVISDNKLWTEVLEVYELT